MPKPSPTTNPGPARYPLVVFDLDGTLVEHHEPVWKTLHARLGSQPERRRQVIAAVRAGRMTYAEWFAADLDLLREAGATREGIVAALSELRAAPGARELVGDLRAAGARVAVLSGGLDLILTTALGDLELDDVQINRIRFDADGRIAGGAATPYDELEKVTGLRRVAERFEVPLARTAFVGDGANDVDVARAAGFSVAWGRASAELRYVCHVSVPGPDMAALRPYLFR